MKFCLTLGYLALLACCICFDTSAEATETKAVNIIFLGDTSFGESYHDRLASEGKEPVLRTRGYDHMIQLLAPILKEGDFTVANLETPITNRFPSPFVGKRKYIHYADVKKTPFFLKKYGVDLVSLANNHAMDYGEAGLEQTLDILKAHQIDSCGAGPNLEHAKQPYVRKLEIGGHIVHLAILCMFEYRQHYDQRFKFYAGAASPGTNMLATRNVSSIVSDLRKKYTNLFVIAYPHWGKNYEWATENQRSQARTLIDAGVDLIVGHGAHMLQEVERYKGRWIVYSLGNFVFGSPGRYSEMQAPPYSAVGMLMISANEGVVQKKLRLYPIFTDNQVSEFQGRFVTKVEFEYVRSFLRTLGGDEKQFDTLVNTNFDVHGHFLEVDVKP